MNEETMNTKTDEEIDINEEDIDETMMEDEVDTEEENTETSEKANVSGGIFKRILNKSTAGFNIITGFFKKMFGHGDSTNDSAGTDEDGKKPGFFSKAKSKIKNFFTAKADFTKGEDEIRSSGLTAVVAFRCAKFVNKLLKKINKKMMCNDSVIAKIIFVIMKIFALVATVALGVAVLYYVVQLLPAILAAVAKCLAACVIIEVLFYLLGATTGCTTTAN